MCVHRVLLYYYLAALENICRRHTVRPRGHRQAAAHCFLDNIMLCGSGVTFPNAGSAGAGALMSCSHQGATGGPYRRIAAGPNFRDLTVEGGSCAFKQVAPVLRFHCVPFRRRWKKKDEDEVGFTGLLYLLRGEFSQMMTRWQMGHSSKGRTIYIWSRLRRFTYRQQKCKQRVQMKVNSEKKWKEKPFKIENVNLFDMTCWYTSMPINQVLWFQDSLVLGESKTGVVSIPGRLINSRRCSLAEKSLVSHSGSGLWQQWHPRPFSSFCCRWTMKAAGDKWSRGTMTCRSDCPV